MIRPPAVHSDVRRHQAGIGQELPDPACWSTTPTISTVDHRNPMLKVRAKDPERPDLDVGPDHLVEPRRPQAEMGEVAGGDVHLGGRSQAGYLPATREMGNELDRDRLTPTMLSHRSGTGDPRANWEPARGLAGGATITPACTIGTTAVTCGRCLMAACADAVRILLRPGVGLSRPSSLGLGAAAATEMPASAPPCVIWSSTRVRPVLAMATSAVSNAWPVPPRPSVRMARPGRRTQFAPGHADRITPVRDPTVLSDRPPASSPRPVGRPQARSGFRRGWPWPGLWVTTSNVQPRSRRSDARRSATVSAASTSRFPVGSSARIKSGIVGNSAGDGHALALASRSS